jgi:multicomponent Na+:H+ antiporter subunit F
VSLFYLAAALGVLLTLLAALPRVLRGPSAADRMLAAQLFGTAGVAFVLLLGKAADSPALLDVALVLALLAAVAITALTRRARDDRDS